MEHAWTTPDYPPHWDDEEADPLEVIMVFGFEGEYYRVYGEWMGTVNDFDGTTRAYRLDDDGIEVAEVRKGPAGFWAAAANAMIKKTYEDLEVVR